MNPGAPWPLEHHEELVEALRAANGGRLPGWALVPDLVALALRGPVPGRRELERRWGVSQREAREALERSGWQGMVEEVGGRVERMQLRGGLNPSRTVEPTLSQGNAPVDSVLHPSRMAEPGLSVRNEPVVGWSPSSSQERNMNKSYKSYNMGEAEPADRSVNLAPPDLARPARQNGPEKASLFPERVETAPSPSERPQASVLSKDEGSVRRVFEAWADLVRALNVERRAQGRRLVPVNRLPADGSTRGPLAKRTAAEVRAWGVERVLLACRFVAEHPDGEWLRDNHENLELLTVLRHVDQYAARWEANPPEGARLEGGGQAKPEDERAPEAIGSPGVGRRRFVRGAR